MNARDVCYFCKEDLGSAYTYHWGNKAHIKCEAANELPTLKRRVEAAGFTIMSKEDVEAVRDDAIEDAARHLEAWGDMYGNNAARSIRALKSGGPDAD